MSDLSSTDVMHESYILLMLSLMDRAGTHMVVIMVYDSEAKAITRSSNYLTYLMSDM